MMNIENLRKELKKENGLDIEEIEMLKNGTVCKGVRIIRNSDDRICPVIYYSKSETLEEFRNRILQAAECNAPNIDVEDLTDWENVKDNLQICVQKKTDENLVKRDYLNLELYVRHYFPANREDESASIKVTPMLLERYGVSEEDFWKTAISNSESKYFLQGMGEFFGFQQEEEMMYVLNTVFRANGASGLYFPQLFENFCIRENIEKCYILPSSIDECIVIPVRAGAEMVSAEELAQMVLEVNSAEVDPIMQLPPASYVYEKGSFDVRVAYVL